MKNYSTILKMCLFATGLSGIVAEYILSTLATYFLGNSVFQWTMIVSIMLFSMGLGSRLSKKFDRALLRKFIFIEFILSLLVSFVSVLTYSASAFTNFTAETIYLLSIIIGLLIGMEIPLVIRINQNYEVLKVNVSSALENDYYGSLLGGIFFAFVGLPILGLIYTPFILGAINLMVAVLLLTSLWDEIEQNERPYFAGLSILLVVVLFLGATFAKRIVEYGEQQRYLDKIVFQEQTPYQKIVITQSGEDYWLFINGNQQLSTLDEVQYHEPLVHPIMSLHPDPRNVLILGGGDGCAAREVLKYEKVESITLVDLDPVMTALGQNHFILTELNQGALKDEKVKVINKDAYTFLEETGDFFDVIIIDLPDPKTIELGRLYSFEFYSLCYKKLRINGVIATQACSPYFATKAFRCIEKTMKNAGFTVVPYHNHILTMGEWGWVLGARGIDKNALKNALVDLRFEKVKTRWVNQSGMKMMMAFGKDLGLSEGDSIKINKIHQPVLAKYYRQGKWEFY